jgi:MFS transporter, MHS family, citrate/tricarballylate:H+ symporter
MSAGRAAQIRTVIRVSSGNFLEMYDFFVFGYYAVAIGRTFFSNAGPCPPS